MNKIIIALVCLVLSIAVKGVELSYPDSVNINCGKIKIRLGADVFWNMNRLIYNELPISVDSRGAYWGTVINFPGIGFVGSGHKESGNSEIIISMKMFADDKYISPKDIEQSREIKCNKFRMIKQAQIIDVIFTYTLIIKNNRLIETCDLKATKDTPLKLMYNFMHPWSEKMTDYYIQVSENEIKQGEFKTDGKFPHQSKFKWIAVYDKNIQTGIVSKASGNDIRCFLWDRANYKKIYLCSFLGKVMYADQQASYSMVTDFFTSSPTDWTKAAQEIAKELRTQLTSHPPPEVPDIITINFEGIRGNCAIDPVKGKKCFELKGNGKFLAKKIPLRLMGNQNYEIDFFIKKGENTNSISNKNHLIVGQYDKTRKFKAFAILGSNIPRDGEWHEIKSKFKTPDTIEDCNLYIYNSDTTDSLFIDEIEIKKIICQGE